MKKKKCIGRWITFFIFAVLGVAQMPLFFSKVHFNSGFGSIEKVMLTLIQLIYLFFAAHIIRNTIFDVIFKFLNKSKLICSYEVYKHNNGVLYRKQRSLWYFTLLLFLLVYPYVIVELQLVKMSSLFLIFYWPVYLCILTFQSRINPRLVFFQGKSMIFDIDSIEPLQSTLRYQTVEKDPTSERVSIKCILGDEGRSPQEVTLWVLDRTVAEEVCASFELVEYYEKYL